MGVVDGEMNRCQLDELLESATWGIVVVWTLACQVFATAVTCSRPRLAKMYKDASSGSYQTLQAPGVRISISLFESDIVPDYFPR